MKKKIQKPFNVKLAQSGASVETKSGNSVRILCYDRLGPSNYPIVALVNYITYEMCYSYTIYGNFCESGDDSKDLIIITEIETKFDKGDYIVSDIGYIYKIIEINDMYHTEQLSSGYKQRWTIEDIDKSFHKWSLYDAKPGDVLCYADGRPFMFKELSDGHPVAYFGIDYEDAILIGNGMIWTYKPVRPANYKEYNSLFKQLKHENYEYNIDTHEITKKEIAWRNNKNVTITGYYIHKNAYIEYTRDHNNTKLNYNIFATEKQAKAALAMARISQIINNDKRFGGAITNEEWSDKPWHVILRRCNNLEISIRYGYEFLAFHEKEQAKLFLKENEDLIKDYYMLD